MGATLSKVTEILLLTKMAVDVVCELFQKLSRGPEHPAPMPQNIPEKSPAVLRQEAQQELGIDSVHSYNFAFAGNSGTGKSSLINALRRVDHNSPDAAKVDEMECTQEINKYTHPQYHHIVFWDMPGGGTLHHSAACYFMDKKLYAFDTIIVVVGNRFSQLDLAIAQSAVKYGVPMVFVKSKMDVDIVNKSLREEVPKKDVKHEIHQDIISSIRQQLPEDLSDRQIFGVSAHTLSGQLDVNDYALDEGMFVKYVVEVATSRRNG